MAPALPRLRSPGAGAIAPVARKPVAPRLRPVASVCYGLPLEKCIPRFPLTEFFFSDSEMALAGRTRQPIAGVPRGPG